MHFSYAANNMIWFCGGVLVLSFFQKGFRFVSLREHAHAIYKDFLELQK